MQFARVATRHGIVSRRQLAQLGGRAPALPAARHHRRAHDRGAAQVARELISGVPARDLERMNPEVLAAILPRIYPQMLDEVHAHQDAGRATFIVSAAGNGVVEPLAAVLGMDGGIGTRYEVDGEGAFTGRFDGPFVYGEGKVEAMEAFAAEHDIDLAESYAYSDSLSDLPMLRAVGNPVVVNPDPALAEIASDEGWQTMRFERLGRRLVARRASPLLATVAGFGGSRIAARRKPRAPPLPGAR